MNRQIQMADGSHDIAEYQVLVFDEYLLDTLYPEMTETYREWIGQEYLDYSHKALGEEGEERLRERLEAMLNRGK